MNTNLNIDYLILISKFIVPFLLGSLLFFSAIIAPTIFKTLDAKNSRIIIRNIFPKLYTWSIIICSLLFFSTLFFSFNLAILSFIILLFYIFGRQFLMPKINFLSDNNENKKFAFYHSVSVTIFIIQILALFFISLRL